MSDNTTDRIKQLERRRDELLESEAYAAGIIELLRGMVDGEAFDVCEEFTEQRHSSVAPITTVRRERDEARAEVEQAHADMSTRWEHSDHLGAKYHRLWIRDKQRAEKAEAALDRVREARSNHPECDRYDESDPVTCGWKRTVQDIDLALIRNETDTKETP